MVLSALVLTTVDNVGLTLIIGMSSGINLVSLGRLFCCIIESTGLTFHFTKEFHYSVEIGIIIELLKTSKNDV